MSTQPADDAPELTPSGDAESQTLATTPADDATLIREEADNRLRKWDSLGRWWSFTHYFAGIAGLVLAVVGAVVSAVEGNRWVGVVLALISAVFIAFVAFINPAKAARDYRAAWRLVDAKRLADIELRTQESLHELNEAIAEGEKVLAGRDPD